MKTDILIEMHLAFEKKCVVQSIYILIVFLSFLPDNTAIYLTFFIIYDNLLKYIELKETFLDNATLNMKV